MHKKALIGRVAGVIPSFLRNIGLIRVMIDAVEKRTGLPCCMQGIGQFNWQTRWNRKLGTV
jgi:hypothetical protein